MIKEMEFYKSLKDVQNYYVEMCICLMKMGRFMMFLTGLYALAMMNYFGCMLGDCKNDLICWVHYLKLLQAFVIYSGYGTNIQEKMPTHPFEIINSFITVLGWWVCLYFYKDVLVEDENMIHFIVIYLVIDKNNIEVSRASYVITII